MRSASAAAFCALLLVSAPCLAGTFQVSSTGVAFGTYDVGQQEAGSAGGVITVLPESDAPATLTLSLGQSLHGQGGEKRRMKHGSAEDFLEYTLTLEGENGMEGETVTRKVTPGTPLVVRVNGLVPAGQNITKGNYRDRVTVNLEW